MHYLKASFIVLGTLAFLFLEKGSHFLFGKAIPWKLIIRSWFLPCAIKGCFGDQALCEAKGEAERGIINNPRVKVI
ncbi:hypothetical protein KSC_014790 [Ktedonobacter sp. SOSP1-52]|nr:hypothetical protein KSC_014790 [Ktedonobacter sp. SOSP1-52]